MPKRNILLLLAACLVCLTAWGVRERSGPARRFGEVIEAIERSALESPPAEELFTAAVDAAVGRLDEHSAYLRGTGRAELEAALDQRFGGVGLELALDKAAERPVVVSPLYGGPAWRAGIAPGDTLLTVAGHDTRGRPLREIVEALRGRAGEPVGLEIAVAPPGGPATLDPGATGPAVQPVPLRKLTLVREEVRLESVLGDRRRPDGSWDWLLEREPGVALVRIVSFGERTGAEFQAACRSLAEQPDLRLVVLDLRGNPGGLVPAAVEVCDTLLAEGPIVATRGRSGAGPAATIQERRATAGELLAGVPVAVLVDCLTSSAAEIVAACLHDAGRATVVGSRTFGKGTVQTLLPLSDDSGLLKLTTAEYLRPSREPIHRHAEARDDEAWGVRPTAGFEVAPTAEALDRLREWRRKRDAVLPPASANAAAAAETAPAAAQTSPAATLGGGPARDIDPVLARALELLTAK
jgi:carboxyl-terminal processing protease